METYRNHQQPLEMMDKNLMIRMTPMGPPNSDQGNIYTPYRHRHHHYHRSKSPHRNAWCKGCGDSPNRSICQPQVPRKGKKDKKKHKKHSGARDNRTAIGQEMGELFYYDDVGTSHEQRFGETHSIMEQQHSTADYTLHPQEIQYGNSYLPSALSPSYMVLRSNDTSTNYQEAMIPPSHIVVNTVQQPQCSPVLYETTQTSGQSEQGLKVHDFNDNSKIPRYNLAYQSNDSYTDVLSFANSVDPPKLHHQYVQNQQSHLDHVNIAGQPSIDHGLRSRPLTPSCSPAQPQIPKAEQRKRIVLWDQRREINAEDLTPEHLEIHREEREIHVAKPRIVKEGVTTNRTIIVPERLIHEEIIEEIQKVQERIIEVAKPLIKERIVEVYGEDEIIENIIEDIHQVVTETIETKEIETVHECVQNVFNDITEEKIVEIPEVEIATIDVYKTLEIPEIREQLVIKEKAVNHYIDKPVPEVHTVKVEQDVTRLVPVPIHQITTVELKLPRIIATYEKIRIPVYLPRFIEIPVAVDLVDETLREKCDKICEEVKQLARAAQMQSVSLCKLESVGVEAKQWEIQIEQALSMRAKTQEDRLMEAWKTDKMQVRHDESIASMSTEDNEFDDYEDQTTDHEHTETSTRSVKSSSDQFSLAGGPDDYHHNSERRFQQNQKQPISNPFSPIRAFANREPQFGSRDDSTEGSRKGSAHSRTPREVKVYRNRRAAARRDVGGCVIESDDYQLVEGGRKSNSINIDDHRVDARSPLQISD